MGDVHGRVEAVEKALAMEGKKIFVGDFMDSFNRTKHDMSKCLSLVIEAIKAGEAEAIYGNHELSYLMPQHHQCSGYSSQNRWMFQQHWLEVEKLFKSHILLTPDLLVTHAGLTRQIWDEYRMNKETLEETLTTWWGNLYSPVHFIGRSRGGRDTVGGTFWCDFNRDFKPIPELTQVFGHTRGKGIRRVENSFCIDCLEDDCDDFLEMDL